MKVGFTGTRAGMCSLCGTETEYRWGVPTYNGDVVSSDFPDDLHSEGGGSMPVCERCYHKHERGEIPTADRWYVRKACFIDGEGI